MGTRTTSTTRKKPPKIGGQKILASSIELKNDPKMFSSNQEITDEERERRELEQEFRNNVTETCQLLGDAITKNTLLLDEKINQIEKRKRKPASYLEGVAIGFLLGLIVAAYLWIDGRDEIEIPLFRVK